MGRSSENWFDRLATPHTRRQGLKAAAVGIAGASLPFARSVPKAEAADSADRRAGCVFTAGKDYERTVFQSSAKYGFQDTLAISGHFGLGLSQLYGILAGYQERKAVDVARANYQADFKSCYQPFCPGFDPSRKAGRAPDAIRPFSAIPAHPYSPDTFAVSIRPVTATATAAVLALRAAVRSSRSGERWLPLMDIELSA